MARGSSPWRRSGLLLLAVSAVGLLLGFGWEQRLSEVEQEALQELELEASEPAPPAVAAESRVGAEQEVISRATAGLPPYKGAVPQALAADYLGPDSRIAVAWFMTQDPPEKVLGFYRDALREADLPVLEHRYHANAGYVGYMDPSTEELHLISVLAQGGESAVFASSGQIASLLETPGGQVPPELPLPAGADAPVVLTFHGEGQVQYSVMARVRDTNVPELVAFYTEELGARGWRFEGPAEHSEGRVLLRARSEAMRVSAVVQPQGPGARLHFTLEKQRKEGDP